VNSFTLALERRNRTTYGHCMRVARYAVAIAEAINASPPELFGGVKFTPKQIKELRYAALLHDIGKIAVPEAVLDKQNKLLDEIRAATFTDVDGQEKPLLTDYEYENLSLKYGNLTANERKQIEQHIVDTWEVLRRVPWPREVSKVANIAACHHEKINGSGYPWKLKGDEVPLGGQILAIVDIFEALTAKDRPYKPAIPIERALQILEEEVTKGKIDRELFALMKEHKIYNLFAKETGFVERPVEPQIPKLKS